MKTTNELIHAGMAKAFFASAWADVQEESETGINLSGKEIMGVMPKKIDPAATRAATTLCNALEQCNGVESLKSLYRRAQAITGGELVLMSDRALEPELFGHYLAMQAMGSGVGLESFGLDTVDGGIVRSGEMLANKGSETAIAVPYLESIQLDLDY